MAEPQAETDEVSAAASQLAAPLQSWIGRRITAVPGKRMMIDRDLTSPHEVSTMVPGAAAKQSIARFPEDFPFQLGNKALESLSSQFVPSKSGRVGRSQEITLNCWPGRANGWP